eukprot:7381228-Prymnesium_polylepis.2
MRVSHTAAALCTRKPRAGTRGRAERHTGARTTWARWSASLWIVSGEPSGLSRARKGREGR